MAKKKRNQDGVVYREFGEAVESIEEAVIDLPPQQQQVRVQISRKGKGGKTVTVVTGLQHPPEKLTALAKKLKSQCGSGGTLKDGNVEIQGDHVAKLVEILVGLGYKAKKSGGK
ncbi:translation initiation factor [filamentous cyanobacterium LEGE 11480]|uniref:Translation initiation factor n=1 Tax=Romeriopsis navalis LEGE 11480 TaxID=2777977 RepID=A0A928VLK1_9CYAN|nr:translation initiation factor [Romeriopsis navalis]MBE9030838.1 translation initiation factor [Romeriopsis navalis LEGE 11480]